MSANLTHLTTIAQLQSNSLPMLVQKEIERMIMAGELAAGDKLNEAMIAERLGVSRGPVREAFRALEGSGLVQLEINRGVFVRRISVEEADEIYDIRAAFDELVGRRLAKYITTEQLKALRVLLEQMDQAAADDDYAVYHALNLAFHDRLVEFTGNKKLLALYSRLVNELNLFRRKALARIGNLPISTHEHHDILDKIASGDAEAAARAMYDHVMASRARMHQSQEVAADASPALPKRIVK